MVLSARDPVSLGQLERTARAFQLEAWDAMRGDIVRAIVEYTTNCDDNYALKGGRGRILIEVEHRRGDEPWVVRIRDRGTGMSLADLKTKIGRQGGRTSQFEAGAQVRGNLGLGAKDPAWFGKVTFESIKDGEYAWFSIDQRGEREAIRRPFKATPAMREDLGIPSSGTVVTIDVTHAVACPRHDTLKQILSNHVQLRDIMLDPDREVFLQHLNKVGARPERLRFVPPKATPRVQKSGVDLPGYPGPKVDVLIAEADEPFADEGRRSQTRRSGLLVKGRRAIYEASLFSFEGNPSALAFTGWIKCDEIDRLAQEYDDRAERGQGHPANNPGPIINRRRDGLNDEHPLVQALRRLGDSELGPLVAERERRARDLGRSVQNEQTTKLLAQLTRIAARFMQDTAEEEELDLPRTAGGEPVPSLAIIPPVLELPAGSERTVSIVAAKSGLEEGGRASVDVEPPDLVEISDREVVLRPSRRRDEVVTTTLRVRAGLALGVTLLTARIGARAAECLIEVVEPMTKLEPSPPERLEFERGHYRLVVGKAKSLKLRAPIGAFPEGAKLRLQSDNQTVVLLDGGEAILTTRRSSNWMEGAVRVEGRRDREQATLRVASPDGTDCACQVEVVLREESGVEFDTKLVPEVQGDQRAQWSSDYRLLKIMGEHAAVRPYLGSKDEGYPGQDSPQVRLLIAELVADAVVRRLLQQKYGEDEVDIATFYVEHYKLVAQLLARAHRIVAAAG